MLAEEIRSEIKEKDDEFHIHQPRKLFLDYIGKVIRQNDKHEAKIYDFRGDKYVYLLSDLLRNMFNPVEALLDEYVRDKRTTLYHLDLTVTDFINTAQFSYKKGRVYLCGYNKNLTFRAELDVTGWDFTQMIIISNEMLEDRMKILKEEGFAVEETTETQHIKQPGFGNPFYDFCGFDLTLPIFLVKLPE